MQNQKTLTNSYDENRNTIDRLLACPDNYGIIRRTLSPGNRRAVIWYTDGLTDTDALNRILFFLLSEPMTIPADASAFAGLCLPYGETEISSDIPTLHKGCATGCFLFLCDAFPDEGILIKARKIPCRSLEEPEHDKVLRGAHIGFGETLPRNCALLRRAMPSPALRMKHYTIGHETKTSVVLCYMEGKAETRYLSYLDEKLKSVNCETLSLGIQSLAECLIRRRVWNPFPRFRYTERPDAAAASIAEGSILILCDNAPQAMILPVSIFSFLQETNDFYMTPFTGTYLRLLRLFTFILSVYLTPVWYALVLFTDLPDWLSFVAVEKMTQVPILIQLILIEIAIDGLKMASMNTPNALSNSLSVIGGLILGEFAIEVGWFLPETILYMSVVAIAHFTQNNYELGYAFKYVRIAMLIMTAALGWWGVLLGTALLLFLLATVPTLDIEPRYFAPMKPYNGKALRSLFFRQRKRVGQ